MRSTAYSDNIKVKEKISRFFDLEYKLYKYFECDNSVESMKDKFNKMADSGNKHTSINLINRYEVNNENITYILNNIK